MIQIHFHLPLRTSLALIIDTQDRDTQKQTFSVYEYGIQYLFIFFKVFYLYQ